MGLFFSGNMYEKNGGDQRMVNRFEKLSQTAEFHGVEKEGLVPQGVKSAFGRLVDIISRPNFAVAGVLDVITGTGREGESRGAVVRLGVPVLGPQNQQSIGGAIDLEITFFARRRDRRNVDLEFVVDP